MNPKAITFLEKVSGGIHGSQEIIHA